MKTKYCNNCGGAFDARDRSSAKYCSEECSFISKIPPTETPTGCLEWRGTIRPDGYGKFVYKQKQTLAHIYAYERLHGKQCAGTVIRHRCDNRKCVNPKHLEPGTHADNVADKVSKDRHCYGSKHSNSVLTEQDIVEICDLIKNKPFNQKEIAAIYGVCTHTIYLIKRGRLWKHITTCNQYTTRRTKPIARYHARKLTDAQVIEIRSNNTDSAAKLAKAYGVSTGAIFNIKCKASWKHL